MAIQLQLRRGTTSENETFVGANGEVTVDVDTNELRIHDGETVGGHIIQKKSEIDAALALKQNVLTAGQNITIEGAVISAASTEYTASDGITLTGNNLTNSGVRSVSTGVSNGTISVNTNGTTSAVTVAGLGSAAYTDSTAYATAAQGTKADTAVQPASLATVATSGSYNDLSNKPTIPAAQVNSNWNATSGVAQILNKPTLATVATSGSYNDLSNKPTIPAAQIQADWTQTTTTAVDFIKNKPALATVATSGSYSDLSNKPTLGTMAAEAKSNYTPTSGLATVATTGSYSDLTNKPTIPAAQVQANWTQTNSASVDFIKNKPTLATVATSGSYTDLSNKPTLGTMAAEAKTSYTPTSGLATVAISGSYTDLSNKPSIPAAQVSSDWNATTGVAQILNKPSLASVATSGSYTDLTNKPTIPAAQVQADWNQASATAVDFIKNKPTIPAAQVQSNWTQSNSSAVDYIKNKPTLATVATSGSYLDLSNKPSIPAAQVNSDWEAASGVAAILHKPTFATVATSGSYNDLTNKPTIPTVNNATLTIQKNGTTIDTFTANASANKTINVTVPTNNNELSNGAGYQTASDVANAVSTKQDTLVSGTNIKTVNGNSILGSGDITLSSAVAWGNITGTITDQADLQRSLYHPNILSWEWDDHLRNDVQWLRGDTFSWQDGEVYEAAYQHLVDDFAAGTFSSTPTDFSERQSLGTEIGSLKAMAYDGEKFVLVSNDGYVSTSTDGVTWTTPTYVSNLSNRYAWNAVSYNNGVFVAVGNTGFISTSTDGTTWSAAVSNSNLGFRGWKALACDGTKFVALTDSGYISTSTDGTNWTASSQNATLGNNSWVSVIYDGQKFVAVSSGGYISTSTDGTTWTEKTRPLSEQNRNWGGIAFDGTKYIVVSDNFSVTRTSTDLTNWTPSVSNAMQEDTRVFLFFGKGRFVATSNGKVFATTQRGDNIDGINVDYKTAPDGHKICAPDQESNLISLYNATGVAWYYILDTTNQRFKLPRAKHNKYESTLGVVGNGMTLGLTNGTDYGGLASQGELIQVTLGMVKPVTTAYGESVTNTGSSRQAMGGTWGVTPDASKSGVIAPQQDETDQYKYLYFYVGSFEQTALENTAGLNTELFNDKADRTLNNVSAGIDFVVETQTPSAGNNYTWYRKYKSGWVEQGGQIQNAFSGTVSFPVEMADTNYAITVTVITSRANASFDRELCPNTLAADGFTITNVGGSGSSGARWEVKGMKA